MSQIVNDRPPVTYHKKTFFQRLALDFRQNKMVYLMWLPVLAFYLIFHYAPMGGLVIAFQNYKPFKGIAKSKFVGLEHFQEFLTGTYAHGSHHGRGPSKDHPALQRDDLGGIRYRILLCVSPGPEE